MPATERTINDVVAGILRETRRAWASSQVVRSETTGTLYNNALRPDILILEASVSPVAVSTAAAMKSAGSPFFLMADEISRRFIRF